MKYLQYITLLAIGVPTIAFGQTKNAAAGDADQAIKKIEADLLAAVLKGDAAAADQHMAAGFVFISPDGDSEDKAEILSDMKSGKLKLTSSQPSDMKIIASDADMAVATYTSVDAGTYDGHDIGGTFRWMDVFAKRDGKWQLVAEQGTRVEKK
ncbi:MAG: nuclear transport factor 2 family protein [Verrucomicrobiota bacterium]|nr:nuclear transport factor 2 family protein [Verrucomicrobiota bacterium]